MHRRHFIQTATLAGTSGLLLTSSTRAHRSTPAPSNGQEGSLTARVARIAPETMREALLTTPVTTPLLPSDTAPVEPVPWDDTSDSDLAGTLGGVVFNTGYDANENYLGIGNAIVHPDAGTATAALIEVGPAPMQHFLGLPWFVQVVTDYAVSAVQIDYLILVGGAESLTGSVDDSGTMSLRAISHMTALLDHLDGVLAELDA